MKRRELRDLFGHLPLFIIYKLRVAEKSRDQKLSWHSFFLLVVMSVVCCVSADIPPGVDASLCAADPLPPGGGTHQPDHQPQGGASHHPHPHHHHHEHHHHPRHCHTYPHPHHYRCRNYYHLYNNYFVISVSTKCSFVIIIIVLVVFNIISIELLSSLSYHHGLQVHHCHYLCRHQHLHLQNPNIHHFQRSQR